MPLSLNISHSCLNRNDKTLRDRHMCIIIVILAILLQFILSWIIPSFDYPKGFKPLESSIIKTLEVPALLGYGR